MNKNRLLKKLIDRKNKLVSDLYELQETNKLKDNDELISRLFKEVLYVKKFNGRLLRKTAIRALILKSVRPQSIINSQEYMKYLKIVKNLVKKVDPNGKSKITDYIDDYEDNNRYAINIFSGCVEI